jgi:hypothetical protein
MVDYHKGQRVRIISGNYKKYGYGSYIGPYGKVMCSVKVEGDTRESRNIWRSSIKAINEEPPSTTGATTNDGDERDERTKAENAALLEEALTDLENIKAATRRLEAMVLTEIGVLKAATLDIEEKIKTVCFDLKY